MIETNQFHIQENWKKYFDISLIPQMIYDI